MWNLKNNDAKGFIDKTQTHVLRKRPYGYKEGGMGEKIRLGVSYCHVHTAISKIDNQYDLLYSTGHGLLNIP